MNAVGQKLDPVPQEFLADSRQTGRVAVIVAGARVILTLCVTV
jgi:hypothetical protein